MHKFKELNIWKKSIELSVDVYELTKSYPETEKFGLTSQIQRCSTSIASNIAEGSSRLSNKDFARFLQIDLGSAFELETQLIISKRVHNLEQNKINKLIDRVVEIQKMINGFRMTIQPK